MDRNNTSDHYSRKQRMTRQLERVGLPEDEIQYSEVIASLKIVNSSDLCMLRAILQDRIYERKRRGMDSEKEQAFLSWLKMR